MGEIFRNTTTIKPNTISLEEAKFQEIYKNISSNIQADSKSHSHISCSFDEMEAKLMMSKSYQGTTELWANGEVKWSFVSIGIDGLEKYGATTDFDLGLNWNDVWTVMEAMKQIESKTCIRFIPYSPTEETKDEPWLLISRDSRSTDLSCKIEKVKSLAHTDIDNLGYIYNRLRDKDSCIAGGAYAWYGSASPQNLVISSIDLDPNNQNHIGALVHELLHNLGLGHTQKRRDASLYINVNYENIDSNNHYSYDPCWGQWCTHYEDYGTPYDCSSIMHYSDTSFITPEAHALGLKTMTPKIANCDLGYKDKLSDGDILLLNNIYCS